MAAGAKVDRIKVLVVDEGATARHGLVSILRSQRDIEAVEEAEDWVQALSQAEQLRPTVVLVDAKLLDGESIRLLKDRIPNVKILCLTVHSREIEPALHAGADAHLMKDGERRKLLRELRRLAFGK